MQLVLSVEISIWNVHVDSFCQEKEQALSVTQPEMVYAYVRNSTSGFYRATACNATHGIAVAILSVCLSVRLSKYKVDHGFPTSHRWSSYVAPKCPKGWLKERFFRFLPCDCM